MHFMDGFGAARRFEGSDAGPMQDPKTTALALDATGALAGDLTPSTRPRPTAAAHPTMHLVRAWTGEATG